MRATVSTFGTPDGNQNAYYSERMAYHLEHFDTDLETTMRTGLGSKSLEGAMDSTSSTFDRRAASAAWIFEDAPGRVKFGSDVMAAVYTPEHGWQKLSTDPRPWWNSLPEGTQNALLEKSGYEVPAKHVTEIVEAGGMMARAEFEESEGAGSWTLTRPLRVFVASVPYLGT